MEAILGHNVDGPSEQGFQFLDQASREPRANRGPRAAVPAAEGELMRVVITGATSGIGQASRADDRWRSGYPSARPPGGSHAA